MKFGLLWTKSCGFLAPTGKLYDLLFHRGKRVRVVCIKM
jgi:hypothetical protein